MRKTFRIIHHIKIQYWQDNFYQQKKGQKQINTIVYQYEVKNCE